jgi:hypothetical protein
VSKTRPIFERYWSLVVAFILPVIEIVVELKYAYPDNELTRVTVSVLCLALLIHSWFMQRRYVKNKWRLAFFTLVLSLIALGPLWLGLNVIRFYSYDLGADYQRNSTLWYHNLYWYTVELQDTIILLAKVLGIAVVLWAIVDLARWLVKRIRAMD